LHFYREPWLLRMGEVIRLPNMVLELRTEKMIKHFLGCDGVARDSDRVSAEHFLPALDKVHSARSERTRVVTRSIALVPEK